MNPYRKTNLVQSGALKKGFEQFIESGNYILGQSVKQFEDEFSLYVGCKYGIGTANGLDALRLILRGYRYLDRLKTGEEIIVPANTYIATILAIIEEGFVPKLVDPNCTTFNLGISEISNAVSEKTKAVMVVHLYGLMSTGNELYDFCRTHDMLLIEDASQAHGASHKSVKAGSQGDAAGFSLYPTKNLGALGDAGIITTSDERLAEVCVKLRNYGRRDNDVYEYIGINSRLDELQAKILNTKLKNLDFENQRRYQIAKTYSRKLNNKKIMQLPIIDETHVYHQYTILIDDREKFLKHCDRHDLKLSIHYRIAPHRQLCFQNQSFYQTKKLPITDYIHKHTCSLPIHPALDHTEIENVVKVVNSYE